MTEKDIKQVLENNMTIAYLTATVELLHVMEAKSTFKKKMVIKDINKKLKRILNVFDTITEHHEGHQYKVDTLINFFGLLVDKELKQILENREKERNEKDTVL